MRQLHALDCAPPCVRADILARQGVVVSRALAGLAVVAMTVAAALLGHPPARAEPDTCPPNCDRIPATAWVDAAVVPLDAVYDWPELAPRAVSQQRPRFAFEEICGTARATGDPRDFAVAAKATVPTPVGQWQLQVQVLHWRGDAVTGAQLADGAVATAAQALRGCGYPARASTTITADEPGMLAAVLSAAGPVPMILHTYLVSDARNGTLVELAMSAAPPPAQAWPPLPDRQVFDALLAPLCVAYVASCR